MHCLFANCTLSRTAAIKGRVSCAAAVVHVGPGTSGPWPIVGGPASTVVARNHIRVRGLRAPTSHNSLSISSENHLHMLLPVSPSDFHERVLMAICRCRKRRFYGVHYLWNNWTWFDAVFGAALLASAARLLVLVILMLAIDLKLWWVVGNREFCLRKLVYLIWLEHFRNFLYDRSDHLFFHTYLHKILTVFL